MTLEEQYKAKEAEMLKTCSKQSHKRHRLLFQMQEIFRQIKKRDQQKQIQEYATR